MKGGGEIVRQTDQRSYYNCSIRTDQSYPCDQGLILDEHYKSEDRRLEPCDIVDRFTSG